MSIENKALLLSGPQHYDERRPLTGNLRKFAEHINPLGIAIVARVARQHCFDLTWRSMDPKGEQDLRGILENVGTVFISSRHYDTSLAEPIIEEAKIMRKKVVVGGYGPTFNPEAFSNADAIVRGEFEPVAEKLMDDLLSGRLQRVYDSTNGEPYDIKNNYIWPDRSIFPEWKGLFKNLQRHSQEWQRGCTNYCSFCSPTRLQRPVSVDGKSHVRVRDTSDIMAEIESMGLEKGNHLFLTDLNTSAIPLEQQRELFGYLKQRGLRWYTEGTVAPLLKDLAENGPDASLMKTMSAKNGSGGCYSFLYGADDLDSEWVAGSLDKNIEYMREAVGVFREFGIPLNLSVVVGLDNHTYPNSFFTFAQVLEEVNPPYSFIHLATPYMGTPWGDKVIKQERIIDTESTHYNHRESVHTPLNMTPDELQQGYYWLLRRLNSPQAIANSARVNYDPKLLREKLFLEILKTGILWRTETFLSTLELQARGYIKPEVQRELDNGYDEWERS